jgi:transcriptional regulator with XRE-family HTH domain
LLPIKNHDFRGIFMALATEEQAILLFISENLKRLRNLHGLTTTEVGKIIGLSRQGYVNFENSQREISICYLVKLAVYYAVSLDELVGNPFTHKSNNKLEFRTYKFENNELIKTEPTTICTKNEDIICVKYDDFNIDFFWRTQTYQKNVPMLFEYYDKPYISKVYFNDDGNVFFFINDEPFFFTKTQAANLVFVGVSASSLKKLYNVENFF